MNYHLLIGSLLLAIACVLVFIGMPNKSGQRPRFLQFEASIVLYPPVILVFFAMGAAGVLAGLAFDRPAARMSLGSKADMCGAPTHVRFTPESGHVRRTRPCPLCAINGHRAVKSHQLNRNMQKIQLGPSADSII